MTYIASTNNIMVSSEQELIAKAAQVIANDTDFQAHVSKSYTDAFLKEAYQSIINQAVKLASKLLLDQRLTSMMESNMPVFLGQFKEEIKP